MINIHSTWDVRPEKFRHVTEREIKDEPMLFNCDFQGALGLGGDITQEFLQSFLPDDWKEDVVIDSRVHMLMPGWFPCIPGWHHDDVPRTREDGQPNYGPGQDRSEHLLMLLNGDICPTAFALGGADLHLPEMGQKLYKKWHNDVELLVRNGVLELDHAPTNQVVIFNDRTWHTGTAAVTAGWRFFIRVSRYFDSAGNRIARRNPRTNETRRQVQVYMENLTEGW